MRMHAEISERSSHTALFGVLDSNKATKDIRQNSNGYDFWNFHNLIPSTSLRTVTTVPR
jgi:hypothetical protein